MASAPAVTVVSDLVEFPERVAGGTVHVLARRRTDDLAIFHQVVNGYRLDELFARFDDHAQLRIVDLGAHIGSFALLAALRFPRARVEAFEMVPGNAEVLRSNLARNGVDDRVAVHEAVVSDRDGWWDPVGWDPLADPNTGRATVADTRFHRRRCTAGMVRVLDSRSLLDGRPIDVLKIDCEGSEYRILYRAAGGLHAVRAMVGELHETVAARTSRGRPCTRAALLELIRARGHEVATFSRRQHDWGVSEHFLTRLIEQ